MNSKSIPDAVSIPGQPTDASPGSPLKIRVLTERAARREALFHPHDNLKRRLPQQFDESDEMPEVGLELADDVEEFETDLVR